MAGRFDVVPGLMEGKIVVFSYIWPKAVKDRPSEIDGRGLAAVAPIAAGEIVAIQLTLVSTPQLPSGWPIRVLRGRSPGGALPPLPG
jgi:hypothetical protein